MSSKATFKTGLQQLFNPQALIPFVIATIMLAILGAAIYDTLKLFFGEGRYSTFLIISLFALAAFLVTAWLFVRFVNRLKPAAPLVGKQSPDKHKGLILLVSSEPVCRHAIKWHTPELRHCWLVCSSEERSIKPGNALQKELRAGGVNARVVHIEDVYDPVEFRDRVNQIYEQLPDDLSESDVILDFTGMTGCASVGSVLACLSDLRPIQYTPAEFDAALKAVQPRDPVEVLLDWRMFTPSVSGNLADSANPATQEVRSLST